MELRETVFEHEHGAQHFTVTCAEQWSCTRIRNLHKQYPEEVEIIAENPDGSILARVPMKWVRVSPPRKMNLTDEYRAELTERGKRLAALRAEAFGKDGR